MGPAADACIMIQRGLTSLGDAAHPPDALA